MDDVHCDPGAPQPELCPSLYSDWHVRLLLALNFLAWYGTPSEDIISLMSVRIGLTSSTEVGFVV